MRTDCKCSRDGAWLFVPFHISIIFTVVFKALSISGAGEKNLVIFTPFNFIYLFFACRTLGYLTCIVEF